VTALRNPTAAEALRLSRWRLSTFWVMLLGYVGYYLVRGNLSVAMPLLSQELGYSNTDLAIILTISEIMYSVGKFTTGPLADKIGGKTVFLIGMAGAIVFNLLFPLNPGILWFTVIWSLCRYFLSMGWGGIMKTIGIWYEPERTGTVMGLISINFQFGGVAAALFAGWLISMGMGWDKLFTIPALVVGGVLIWSWLASKESPAHVVPGVRFGSLGARKPRLESLSHENEAHLGFREILGTLVRVRLFRQIVVFSFVAHLLRSTFMYWTPKILVDLGLGNVKAAFSSAVFPLMGCLGTIFIGWYTDRFSRDGNRTGMMTLMLAGLVACMLGIAFLIPVGTDASRMGIVVLLGLSGFLMYGPYSLSAGAMALDLVGARAIGTCTGIIDGVGYIGGAVASWGAGVMADQAGWREVFLALAVISVFCTYWTWHMGRSNWPRSPHEKRA
jgi:sugar phosphate permease